MCVGEAFIEVRRISLTMREVAAVLRCSPSRIEALVRTVRLNNVGYGARYRFDPDEVASLVAERVDSGELPHGAQVQLGKMLSTPR